MRGTYIYNDNCAESTKLKEWFAANIKRVYLETKPVYDWGMNRRQVSHVKANLNAELEPLGFVITDRVEHAHGIGNNNLYEVEYTSSDKPDTHTVVGRIYLNSDMFGGVFCGLEDLDGEVICKM